MASVAHKFLYDVFLSFRGEDTRHCFTGNLWKALNHNGLRTFMDDEELRKGDEITKSLLQAIEDSKIAIVVLSENYASSSFCLEELSKILDSMKDKADCSILPIFYNVDPSDIRKLQKTYGEAMAKHMANSNPNLDKWKASLDQVASLCGSHYKKGDMYEHVFIGKIVEEVLKKITLGITLHVGDYLVGLEPQKQRLISLLNVGSDDTVHMVGIHGIGGIGKTTLALEVYNSTVHQFQCSCFLKVRENYHKNGLVLQKILLSQIVEKNIEINSVEEGISILQKILSKNKVLLLLDDVDNEKQLQAIAGKPNWFGLGSRVIITTRNQRLLTLHGVEAEHTYEVKELNDKDAFELVRWNAFKNEKTDRVFSGYAHVLDRAVAYASGLPLALEVIGSHFSNRTIEECKCALDQCERVLDEKIQMTLQLSFDDLKKEEKIVFLDIACCLKGYKLTTVEQILRAHHGYSIRNHINVLVEKSLIKISEFGNVTLHDLIEDMGKDIVRQESPNPGERSRLWDSDDIEEVLEENKEASKIGIIYVNNWIKDKQDGKAFNKMENLKTLLIDKRGHFYGSLKHLPNSLRVLDCRSSYFTIQAKFQNMRVLNFDCKGGVLEIHDLANLPNLEEISIENGHCDFTIAYKSVCFLSKLKILRIIRCRDIKSVPPLDCPSLIELDLSYCANLESFPLTVNGFRGQLKILRLINCSKIKIIPLIMLDSLEELNLRGCTNLKTIPPLKLASFEELDLSDCTSLESFPHVVDGFLGKLKTLLLTNCHNLKSIPPIKLDSLEKVDFSNCHLLERYSNLGNLNLSKRDAVLSMNPTPSSRVEYICHENCKVSLDYLSDRLLMFANVKELHLTKNRITVLPKSIKEFKFLSRLILDDCKELQEIQEIPPSLKSLSALNCQALTSSCKTKLLNQKLHEAGNTWFRLPRAKIPEWFDQQWSEGLLISFWFRNKFPTIILCVVSPLTWNDGPHSARVIINGNTFFIMHGLNIRSSSTRDTYHLNLFHLLMENFNDKMDNALFENKWNYAEVDFGFPFMYSGIHVLKDKSSMEDIQFFNPEIELY
ncbi:unnamed protein product [Trifolium pratense]|uniref:Uncharacterized protein n=1 Tax=Trifolium pratense TaxID=57577 RepID=A0ACB0LC72_TRIPR|nr:unnamed protein product [Trifolium pratense]